MLGDLSQDIIGTDPKYPAIVNQEWLTPNIESYDNYPSDNNSVRIQPKLSELWNNDVNTGINLIPNSTTAQPVRITQWDMKCSSDQEEIDGVIREAKKAMMIGLTGTQLASHLRSRFAASSLLKSKEALEKLSEEQGLLGNVYIDASAFTSSKEAEQFLSQHRSRLAQDIVVNESKLNSNIISVLASKFHKNVVASIDYNEKLFNKYKAHLVDAKKIASNVIIDSKESLRAAFLYEPVKIETVKAVEDVKLSEEEIAKTLSEMAGKSAMVNKMAEETLLYRKARPIIVYAREKLVKGKTGTDLKEVLMKKFAESDLRDSAKYLALVVSEDFLTNENIDKLVAANRITEKIGDDLKKIAKDYPIKHATFITEKREKTVGVPGYFHVMSPTVHSTTNELCEEIKNGLRNGASIEQMKDSLLSKVSVAEADNILSEAVKDFNNASAGIKANVYVKPPKEKVVADLKERETLPDPSTIKADTQEIINFFGGQNAGIEINPVRKTESLDFDISFNSSGLDAGL